MDGAPDAGRTIIGTTQMQKIRPFLWFDNNAEEAMKFYTSIFNKSKIGQITRYGGWAGSEGVGDDRDVHD
jgi:predicted 3-demethylubiquinone-9 3-methyltransferase (glyoxalase superfamily)